jgi:hypothetical protein
MPRLLMLIKDIYRRMVKIKEYLFGSIADQNEYEEIEFE